MGTTCRPTWNVLGQWSDIQPQDGTQTSAKWREVKRARHKRSHAVWFHSYEIPRAEESRDRKGRVDASSWENEAQWTEASLWDENVLELDGWRLCNIANVQNATELYTFQVYFLLVNFTSIQKNYVTKEFWNVKWDDITSQCHPLSEPVRFLMCKKSLVLTQLSGTKAALSKYLFFSRNASYNKRKQEMKICLR